MKKLLWLNATLLLGTSGALLWILGQVVVNGRILLGEPNGYIIGAELGVTVACLYVALMALLYLLKGVKK